MDVRQKIACEAHPAMPVVIDSKAFESKVFRYQFAAQEITLLCVCMRRVGDKSATAEENAVVRQTPDGLTRVDFVNGRPDSVDVLMKGKRLVK